jgi:hypothetical protein
MDPTLNARIQAHEEIIPGDADWKLFGTYAGE